MLLLLLSFVVSEDRLVLLVVVVDGVTSSGVSSLSLVDEERLSSSVSTSSCSETFEDDGIDAFVSVLDTRVRPSPRPPPLRRLGLLLLLLLVWKPSSSLKSRCLLSLSWLMLMLLRKVMADKVLQFIGCPVSSPVAIYAG